MPVNQHTQTVMEGEATIDFQYDTTHNSLGIGVRCPLGNTFTFLSSYETAKLFKWLKDQVGGVGTMRERMETENGNSFVTISVRNNGKIYITVGDKEEIAIGQLTKSEAATLSATLKKAVNVSWSKEKVDTAAATG